MYTHIIWTCQASCFPLSPVLMLKVKLTGCSVIFTLLTSERYCSSHLTLSRILCYSSLNSLASVFRAGCLRGLGDSQVILKVTGEDTIPAAWVFLALQVNTASVSSFCAEYSSTEEVVERPVTSFTSTEAWMEIPRQKTNNFVSKL